MLDVHDDPAWDAIARGLGMPDDWREIGYDEPATMVSHYSNGGMHAMACPWPRCSFRRVNDVEAMFRHVHSPTGHSDQRKPVERKRNTSGLE